MSYSKTNVKMKLLFAVVTTMLLVLFFASCKNKGKQASDNSITIFHAGSLSVPFKELADSFMAENPDIKFFLESSGSVDAARKISDLGKPCDVLAVADYLVIEKLIIPDHSSWNYSFASNEMIIAYSPESLRSDEISSDNWIDIISDENVMIGRSEPNADPCGYRTVFMFKLAEQYYRIPGLTEKLMSKKNTVIRPKEVDLLALLESGNIDYLFIYRSVAQQHKHNYIELPPQLHLGDPQHGDFYSSVNFFVDANVPGNKAEISGSPIMYSFTIPFNSANPDLAKKFLEFVIDPHKGGKILEKNGMKPQYYYPEKYSEAIPEILKKT